MISSQRKSFALLLDPDKLDEAIISERISAINQSHIDYIFVGGSLISSGNMDMVLQELKARTNIPTIIFPGNGIHINKRADAILLLSLISGRNPEFLIGQHVVSAPFLKRSGLEILSTGYILIDGGKPTTVSYISNTTPIPADKPDVAAATAMAGEMLGHQLIYLDAGSGAKTSISQKLIKTVKEAISVPLIVGGGMRTLSQVADAYSAGADVVVIGNAIEENPEFLMEVSELVEAYNISQS